MLMCWRKLKHRLVHITHSSEKTKKEFHNYAHMYTIISQKLVSNLAGVHKHYSIACIDHEVQHVT